MWNLPGPGIVPTSPALAGGFLTTGPPGKPKREVFTWISGARAFCPYHLPSLHFQPLVPSLCSQTAHARLPQDLCTCGGPSLTFLDVLFPLLFPQRCAACALISSGLLSDVPGQLRLAWHPTVVFSLSPPCFPVLVTCFFPDIISQCVPLLSVSS